MANKTSRYTTIIDNAVNRGLEILHKVLSEDFELGIMEMGVDQDRLRSLFYEVATAVDMPTYLAKEAAFVQQFGQEEFDRQAHLYMRRA